MNLLGVLQLLTTLAPLVKGAVEAAEALFGAGRGTAKAKHALDAVSQALPGVAALAGQVDAARAAVGPLIEATVAAANASGAFKRSKRRRKKNG